VRILFVGDVFGRAGRDVLYARLPGLVRDHQAELVIVNGENAAAGFGITPQIAEDFFDLGVDVVTTGNHIWDKKEIYEYLAGKNGETHNAKRLLRPANYPAQSPGSGLFEGKTGSGIPYAVINVQGRVFMVDNDDPFRAVDALLKQVKAKVVFVDMHAEVTSEKMAMGWYLDGRVTAVVGTHTHVPTADERVLPGGTAFCTDVGMTGPYDSVIGVEKELVLQRFLTNMPGKFSPATGDPWLCAVLIDTDEQTGKARSIEHLILRETAPAKK
jgi:metallophosphoesterase (TIGR00282 family)